MNAFLLLAAMTALPLAVLVNGLIHLNRLKMQRDHDRMLYRLCSIRDEMALLTLEGKVSEDSRVFSFFYSALAGMVHHHRQAGICFREMIRFVGREIRDFPKGSDNDGGSLGDEINASPKAVQRLAHEFCRVIVHGLMHSIGFIVLDRVISRFKKIDYYTILQKVFILSSVNRSVLQFCESIDRPKSGGSLSHA